MKRDKVSKGGFLGGKSKILPKTKEKNSKMKFMGGKERVALTKKLAHFEATKDITI
jgi:hypothetical protein